MLAQNSDAGNDPLKVDVVAQQFAWQFSYDDGKTSTRCCALPVDRTVELDDHRERRHPLVLGAAVRAEAGRRAGRDAEARDHAEPGSARTP